jgi:CPA2 family monovalent cation:H+ antiporter-2
MSPDHSALPIVLTLLATAVAVVVVFRRLHLPPLLGYLAAGVLLGGLSTLLSGFGSAGSAGRSNAALASLAEFGVVFLMFSIGLEFSLPKLSAMRRGVFLVGGSQVGITLLVGVLAAVAMQVWATQGLPTPDILQGLDWRAGVVLGGALAMSSTAIVIKALSEQLQLDSAHGRSVVGVLLFQDLAVVLLLVLVPAIAASSSDAQAHSLLWTLGVAAAKAAALLTLLLVFGQRLMQRLFDMIARQQSRELFTLTVLLITLGLAWVTELAGLSLALGAFVAGMLIAETPYRHAVEEDIKPFRDVLLGLFFLTLGMQLDMAVLLRQPLWVLLCFALPMLLKGGLVYGIVVNRRLGAAPESTALRSALALCAAGEFGFVLLSIANQNAAAPLLGSELSQVLLAAMVLSMIAAPLLIQHSDALVLRITEWLNGRSKIAPADNDLWMNQALQLHQSAAQTLAHQNHVIVLGYGRSGQAVAQVLRSQGIAVLALDLDPDRVREARAAGQRVEFGDAARQGTLQTLGLNRARALVISFDNPAIQHKVLHDVHALAPQLPVVVRTHDESHIAALKAAGASDVVPELVEGSLMLASHALLRLGVPMRRVLHAVQAARGDGYQGLASYFHGADDEDHGEAQLHTVVLTESAWALRHTVSQCKAALSAVGVTVKAVRGVLGDDLNDAQSSEELGEEGSAWVLQGTVSALDAAENVLLAGKHGSYKAVPSTV